MNKVPFSEPLKFLSFVGMNPLKTSTFSISLSITFVITFAIRTILDFLVIQLNLNSLDAVLCATYFFTPQYQELWRIIVFFKYKSELGVLIKRTEHFWPLIQFGRSWQMQNISVHNTVRRLFLCYAWSIYVGVIIFFAFTFDKNKAMMMCNGEAKKQRSPFKELTLLLDLVYSFSVCSFIVGFNGLFFYLLFHALTELKMIKSAFTMEQIAPCLPGNKIFLDTVKRHIDVLRFIGDIKTIYSQLLLNQQLCYLSAICFGLFMMNKDGIPPDYTHLLKYIPYLSIFLAELFAYCYAGNLISDWSQEISEAFFHKVFISPNFSEDDCPAVVLILLRSQKAASLALGGFGKLNLASFTFVLRMGYSFFAFLNAIKSK